MDERTRLLGFKTATSRYVEISIDEDKDLIEEGKKICHYSDENIKIFSPNKKGERPAMYLIEYGDKYYIAHNTIKYIIEIFYKKVIIGDK